MFGQLSDTEFLTDVGFTNYRTGHIATWTDVESEAEDTFATLAGRMATRLVTSMATRTLYFFGLPHGMTVVLSEKDGVAKKAFVGLARAKDVKHALFDVEKPGRVLTMYKVMHCFNKLAVQQVVAICEKNNYAVEGLQPHIDQCTLNTLSSVGVEELNNSQEQKTPCRALCVGEGAGGPRHVWQ